MGFSVHFLPALCRQPEDTPGLPQGSSIPKGRGSRGPFQKEETQLRAETCSLLTSLHFPRGWFSTVSSLEDLC